MSLKYLNERILEVDRQKNLQANYDKTLLLLAALKSGEVTTDSYAMVPGGWNIVLPPPDEILVTIDIPGPNDTTE